MDDLLVRAERVFPLKPIPKQLVLATIDISLDIPSEVVARVDGKTWNKVVAEDWLNIATIDAIRATMTVDAFRYYLPSFLCLAFTSKPMLSVRHRRIVTR
jgi:hypothetical protein